MRKEGCLFCELQKNKDLVIMESETIYVIKDKYPARKGHLLIIPKDHYETFFDAPLSIKNDMMEMTEKAKEYLDKQYSPTGYRVQINIGKDGMQEIFHLHLHLIPAYPHAPFIKG